MLLLPDSLSLPDILSVLLVSVNTPTCAFLPTSLLFPSLLLFFHFFIPMFAPYQPLSPVQSAGKLFLPNFLWHYLGKGGTACRFYIIHVLRAHPCKLGNSGGYSCGETARGLSSAGRVSPGVFYSISLKCHDLFPALLMVSALLALTGSHVSPLLPPCL